MTADGILLNQRVPIQWGRFGVTVPWQCMRGSYKSQALLGGDECTGILVESPSSLVGHHDVSSLVVHSGVAGAGWRDPSHMGPFAGLPASAVEGGHEAQLLAAGPPVIECGGLYGPTSKRSSCLGLEHPANTVCR